MAGILIIDDDIFICRTIQKQLANQGFVVEVAFTGISGLKRLKDHHFELVLCDFRLPDKDGLEMLQQIKKMDRRIKVVIITAYADVRIAVKLIKLGADDYIVKPLRSEEILGLARRLTGDDISSMRWDYIGDFITGSSNAFKKAVEYAKIVAPTEMAVLIEGETGTGKEYVARYIHGQSMRRDKPFFAVDCGAIPKELAGSELFGHVKGSFTGAVSHKNGVFQQANGGTLFLDEIGNLGYSIQVQLLRVLQEKTVTRIGDNKTSKTDLRIISASNESLLDLAEKKLFRDDLLHRINEFRISLPPLRARGRDILLFTDQFREMANRELNLNCKGFSEETLNIFTEYDWPGNIRELKNVVKRAVLISSGEIVKPEDLPAEIIQSTRRYNGRTNNISQPEYSQDLQSASGEMEKKIIIKAIEDAGYNKSKAARLLNIDRKTLYNKIKKYNIDI
ncbi:MAG: sigma-54 dependent transcriptional regulator [Prolixibacteraceae bacterium]|nr:sigma-54 dependent transcriptional regulator [Prolixibacteraceae bacterium]